MKRQSLNIKTNKGDQFESVSFVHEMTEFQLKVLIKRLFKNFGDLANAMDNRDRKVSKVIDAILDGRTWNEKDLNDRYQYLYYGAETIVYDTMENKFSILHNDGQVTPYDSMTRKQLDDLHKKIKRAKGRKK